MVTFGIVDVITSAAFGVVDIIVAFVVAVAYANVDAVVLFAGAVVVVAAALAVVDVAAVVFLIIVVVVIKVLVLGQLVHDEVDADVDAEAFRHVVDDSQRRPMTRSVTLAPMS